MDYISWYVLVSAISAIHPADGGSVELVGRGEEKGGEMNTAIRVNYSVNDFKSLRVSIPEKGDSNWHIG